MLELIQSLVGCPDSGLEHLELATQSLLLYPSAESIVILNAPSLELVRVLAFWEAFPGTQHTNESVNCISVDSSMKIIVACMNSRIATWSLSGVQKTTWRVHSSLILPYGHVGTSVDISCGLLAVGSQCSLSVYTLRLENDLPTWSQKWSSAATSPSLTRFSPCLTLIAITCPNDSSVRIYSTTSGRQIQAIPHPRTVTNITWRHAQASSRNDLILYTVTSDSTLRIFLTVLDAPQHLQLHATLDLFSSLTFPIASKYAQLPKSSVFWLDRNLMSSSLSVCSRNHAGGEDSRTRRIKEVDEAGWDIFLRLLGDGSVVITAVANIDRRPPTLLEQFPLHHSHPLTLPTPPLHLHLLPNPDPSCLTLVTLPPLTTFDFSPLDFFDGRIEGLRFRARSVVGTTGEKQKITKIARSPEGKGLGVIRSDGCETWRMTKSATMLIPAGQWSAADLVAVLDTGKVIATYRFSDHILTLHSNPPATLSLPLVSSISPLPPEGDSMSILGIATDMSVVVVRVSSAHKLTLYSHDTLPVPSPPIVIVPIDPMGRSSSGGGDDHSTLLSISEAGELNFWAHGTEWRCTGRVSTGRKSLKLAACSSMKKSALVACTPEGQELTIWDSNESEFASGLEVSRVFSPPESISGIDWCPASNGQSILAIGFSRRIEILCQQRMTYFDGGPGWATCWKIDIANIVPYSITQFTWLAHGSLVIATAHHMLLFSQPKSRSDENSCDHLFEYVARQTGPLPDYHPQMLLQCLLWGKVELVKDIIVKLARYAAEIKSGERKPWGNIPLEQFLRDDPRTKPNNHHRKHRVNHAFQVNGQDQKIHSAEEGFSRTLVLGLIEALELNPLSDLTPNEQAHLLVLIQTTLEVYEQQRALDANGLRYLISMRSFYILNHRSSAPGTPQTKGAIPRPTGRRIRLRYRDMIWAFHSESQEIMLTASVAACNGKMCWSDARALGVFVWLRSAEALRSQMDMIARNEYMAGNLRDPTACSLFYFALGKVNLLHGLWRQAAWHKEQTMMLKFLSNDFTQPRWRTAALKNAFALLSKQRFEYAAAFFLLGGSLKDAVSVCTRQLSDFQLAIALARIVEQSDDGPILRDVLTGTVLPEAFRNGNRWLASWAFWMLHRRDLAVRILLTPLRDIVHSLEVPIPDIADSQYDDPSLALLFAQLRSKTLQTAQGTSEISGRSEFNFVLQIARVFCRMGCHILALDLVRSWSFERPSFSATPRTAPRQTSPNLMMSRRPKHRPLAVRRQSSIIIDIDIPSLPPTRRASPAPDFRKISEPETIREEGDLFARKAGFGSLMKSAKRDVKVPEFDMDAFI